MQINLVPKLLSLIIIFIIFNTTTIAVSDTTTDTSTILNTTSQWLNYLNLNQPTIQLSMSTIIAAFLTFFAASISSAGGIGGGGLFISIMTIIVGLQMKVASSFSAFMVTGVSIANVGYNLSRGKILIDFDLALLLQPCLLLGVSIGVICNRMSPNWLVTSLFAVFLAWSTMKTCKKGMFYWRSESERGEGVEGARLPLLAGNEGGERKFPWKKLGVLVIIWLLFFLINFFRGNKYGQGIISIKPCGALYWLLSSLQLPLTIFFTLWICSSDNVQGNHTSQNQDSQMEIGDDARTSHEASKFMLPILALLAGVLAGLFGIGGGMLISPLLLQIGFPPEVTAATCSFMVLFSSLMSSIQYSLLGMENAGTAAIFAMICFVASLIGLMVVKKVIAKYGRASIIVFAVGIVMALSTVLITTRGALNVWDDLVSGRYMGFKLPC